MRFTLPNKAVSRQGGLTLISAHRLLIVVIAGLLAIVCAAYINIRIGRGYGSSSGSSGYSSNSVKQQEAYLMSPQKPARIEIPEIAVNADVVAVGVDNEGRMDTPLNLSSIGWYEKSAVLGESHRSILLNGHYGIEKPEVLRRLNELKVGSLIRLHGDKGDAASYMVVEIEQMPVHDVDMEKAFNYGSNDEEALSIITCIGRYIEELETYDERYIVYAKRIYEQ